MGQATDPTCFSEREFEDILLITAPAALKVMGDQCSPVLHPGFVLGNPESAVTKGVEAASREAWPRAFRSIARVMKSEGPGGSTMTRETFNAGIAPTFGRIITNLNSCGPVDKILKLAEPLPPRSLAGILIQILRITPNELKVLCPANR
jgi:hypothetical protein